MNRATVIAVQQALLEYESNRTTTAEIAAKVGVSKSTITFWARRARLRQRHTGRRLVEVPSVYHRQILRQAMFLSFAEIARRNNTTRQNIDRILQRWKAWIPYDK